MKKALLIVSTHDAGPDGLTTECRSFASLLLAIGVEVRIAFSPLPSDCPLPGEWRENTVPSLIAQEMTEGAVYPGPYGVRFRSVLAYLQRALKADPPDVVIAFGAGYNGMFAAAYAETLAVKMILVCRGAELLNAPFDADLHHANERCLRSASAVVGVSDELTKAAAAYSAPSAVMRRTIPVPVEIQLPCDGRRSGGSFIFGTAIRTVDDETSCERLIAALRMLRSDQHIDARLEIAGVIGDSLRAKYVHLAESLGVSEHLRLSGYLGGERYTATLRSWNCIVQDSPVDGFPGVLADAVALGKPFLALGSGYCAEQLADAVPEFVCVDSSPGGLAEALATIARSSSVSEWTASAVGRLRDTCSRGTVGAQWSEVFDWIAAGLPRVSRPQRHVHSLILHDVSEHGLGNIEFSAQALERLCERVRASGGRFCSAREFFQQPERDDLIVCTFDDAYQGVIEHAFPVLNKFGFTATVFVCSDFIGTMNRWNHRDKNNRRHLDLAALKELYRSGWEIGSHGTNHISLLRLTREEIIGTLQRSKAALAEHFGPIISFAYPYGDFTRLIEQLAAAEYENVFASGSGGTHAVLDRLKLRRYSPDELERMLN